MPMVLNKICKGEVEAKIQNLCILEPEADETKGTS